MIERANKRVEIVFGHFMGDLNGTHIDLYLRVTFPIYEYLRK